MLFCDAKSSVRVIFAPLEGLPWPSDSDQARALRPLRSTVEYLQLL